MEDSEKNETERSAEPVERKTEEGEVNSGRVVEAGPPVESVVKSLEEEFTQAAKSMVENVPQSSFVTGVEKEVEKLVHVSDSWVSLKNLGAAAEQNQTPALPTLDENVGESSVDTKSSDETVVEKVDLDENPRTTHTHTQPFVAVSAGTRASWANCCGLLDVLKCSDQ